MQRVLSMKDVGMALRLFRISSVFMFFRAAVPMFWGIAALVVLSKIPGQFGAQTSLADMLIRVLPAGMIGFITVGFLAASMSTYSSYLLSFSAIGIQDVVAPLVRRPLSGKQRINLTRMAVIIIGVFIYIWGVCYHLPETVFRCIALTASLSYAGTITGLAGGLYWQKASKVGAYCAFAVSVVPPILSILFSILPNVNFKMSETAAGALSFVLAPAAMIAGSLLFPSKVSQTQ
jgi:solute:Na+ symporter, SSS family